MKTQMKITTDVRDGIRTHIGSFPAERGGLLGSTRPGRIDEFVPDTTARCTRGAYDPDIDAMNRQIKKWKSQGVQFCGFVHSHPPGVRRLSGYDVWYAGEILDVFKKLDRLCLPIVMTEPDTGKFEIIPYSAIPNEDDRKQVDIERDELSVISTHDDIASKFMESPKNAVANTKRRYFGNFPDPGRTSIIASKAHEMPSDWADRALRDQYLDRLKGHYDIDHLDRTRVVVVGNGGGQSLVRNMARMGFGEFVLIDPDVVTASNVGSQQAEPAAIGEEKVVSLANDIRRLNPASAVITIADRIESLTDEEFQSLAWDPTRMKPNRRNTGNGRALSAALSPEQVLLLVLTDNFYAQTRGHRLGLQLGLPTICAQEYKDGLGAEVTYTVPGLTPACHRCITASRYKAYLDEDYSNDVTSHGAPIFAAEHLNSILGHVVLAVAHHGTKHPHWGNVANRLGNRNLVRVRMHPDFDEHFGSTFSRRHEGAAGQDSLFMLDTLFLAQSPDSGQSEDRPVCPDCGGTGDLSDAIGTFADTRQMRR